MVHGKPGYKRCNLVQEPTSEDIRSEPSLTYLIEKRRNLRSTHTVPSDAGHAPSENTRQSQFRRIDQWATTITPVLATPSNAMRSHSATRRTGTDLENEEISIGTARSRSRPDNQTHSESEHEPGEASLPHNASPSQHSAVLEDRGQDLNHDYYEKKAFRILIGCIILQVSGVIIIVVLASSKSVGSLWVEIPTVYQTLFVAVPINFLLYPGLFVVDMASDRAVGNLPRRYARLRRGLQHFGFRLCVFVCGFVATFVINSRWHPKSKRLQANTAGPTAGSP